MAWISIKRVFKQHASMVVTVPLIVRSRLDIERGDYVVFEYDEDEDVVKFYKWHKGMERSYPDYGHEDLRHKGGKKRTARGCGR